jgi:hypothetical protein
VNIRTKYRFYVYRLFDGDRTLYVGKGSRNRLTQQKRVHQCDGEILEGHRRERDAYKRERHFIATLKPERNKHPGGNGSTATRVIVRRAKYEIEYERVGPRRYTARMLLGFDLTGYLNPSEIDAIRQVADGPRC